MSPKHSDERVRAFHEVGHCWGYWYTGRPFRYTTLRPRTPGLDAATVGTRDWDFDELDPLAVVAVCGPLAEIRYRKQVDPDRDIESILVDVNIGAQHDRPKMELILKDGPRIKGLSRLVAFHWDGISQVAEELIQLRTLKGPRVVEILDASDPGVPEYPRIDHKS